LITGADGNALTTDADGNALTFDTVDDARQFLQDQVGIDASQV